MQLQSDTQQVNHSSVEPDHPLLLSLVLCSRNDQFQGNSLWRLETSLNFAARQIADLGHLNDVEIIVTDWGSTELLRDVVRLGEEAHKIVRFLTIPTALAKEKQQDSRFAEVFAINAAARRARGQYIGRLDQDTLVGHGFLKWFFTALSDPQSQQFPLESTMMISNRRRIPYDFAVRCPQFPVIEKYVKWFEQVLPQMARPMPDSEYWQCYIGIVLLHRQLWDECGGYDESFIYYSFMEFDLFLRLHMRYEGVDLGRVVNDDFYHLDHVPGWLIWHKPRAGRENPIRTVENPPLEFCPSGSEWGLVDYQLALEPASSDPIPVTADEMSWSASHWLNLITLTVISTILTLGSITFDHLRSLVHQSKSLVPRSKRWIKRRLPQTILRKRPGGIGLS